MHVHTMRSGTRQTIGIEVAVAVRTLAEACTIGHDTRASPAGNAPADARVVPAELHPAQVTGPGGESLQRGVDGSAPDPAR